MNILARFTEPSTWAGIAVLTTMFGVPTNKTEAGAQLIGAIFSAFAIIMPELQPVVAASHAVNQVVTAMQPHTPQAPTFDSGIPPATV